MAVVQVGLLFDTILFLVCCCFYRLCKYKTQSFTDASASPVSHLDWMLLTCVRIHTHTRAHIFDCLRATYNSWLILLHYIQAETVFTCSLILYFMFVAFALTIYIIYFLFSNNYNQVAEAYSTSQHTSAVRHIEWLGTFRRISLVLAERLSLLIVPTHIIPHTTTIHTMPDAVVVKLSQFDVMCACVCVMRVFDMCLQH